MYKLGYVAQEEGKRRARVTKKETDSRWEEDMLYVGDRGVKKRSV